MFQCSGCPTSDGALACRAPTRRLCPNQPLTSRPGRGVGVGEYGDGLRQGASRTRAPGACAHGSMPHAQPGRRHCGVDRSALRWPRDVRSGVAGELPAVGPRGCVHGWLDGYCAEWLSHRLAPPPPPAADRPRAHGSGALRLAALARLGRARASMGGPLLARAAARRWLGPASQRQPCPPRSLAALPRASPRSGRDQTFLLPGASSQSSSSLARIHTHVKSSGHEHLVQAGPKQFRVLSARRRNARMKDLILLANTPPGQQTTPSETLLGLPPKGGAHLARLRWRLA